MRITGFGLIVGVLAAAPALAAGPDGPAAHDAASHHAMEASQPSPNFVQAVRNATARFRDINVVLAPSSGYGQFLGCFSSPGEGAMGVHFVNVNSVFDGSLDINQPEAVIYEPQADGSFRLVGLEYITTVQSWHDNNPHATATDAGNNTPVLKINPQDGTEVGQVLQLVDGVPANDGFAHTPNRFGLPPFYELHVWAWQDNPKGTFADWNTLVSCDKQ